MRVELNRQSLKNALGKLTKTADCKGNIPVLACVLFESKNGKASLTTTNLEVTGWVELPAKGEGTFLLPIKRLERIISKSKGKQIAFEVKEEGENGNRQILVDTGKTVFTLEEPFPVDEFPELEKSFKPLMSMGSSTFNYIVRKLFPFTYREQRNTDRVVLSSIRVEGKKDALFFASTDGHVLGWYRVEWEEAPEKEFGFLISPKAAQLVKQFTAEAESVEVGINSKDEVILKAGNCYLLWKQEEAQYPNWRSVIPDSSTYKVTFCRNSVLEAVEEVGVIVEDDAFPTVRFSFSANELLITAVTVNKTEKATSKVNIKAELDSPHEVGFHLGKLLTTLKSFPPKTVNVQFSEHYAPFLFSSPEEPEFNVLLMPVKL